MAEGIPLPKIKLTEVLDLRDRLFEYAMPAAIGRDIPINELVARIIDIMPGTLSNNAVFESVRYLAGSPCTRAEAFRLSWRLAGNVDKLRAGEPVAAKLVLSGGYWAPVLCLRHDTARSPRRGVIHRYKFRVISGEACPMFGYQDWSYQATAYVASRVGFSRPWGKFPFRKSSHLVGLRMFAWVSAERSRDTPVFTQFDASGTMRKWNRDNVLKLRLRVGGKECPVRYQHACDMCAIGYDRCDAATHAVTYTIDDCNTCNERGVHFDPEESVTMCRACCHKRRLSQEAVTRGK